MALRDLIGNRLRHALKGAAGVVRSVTRPAESVVGIAADAIRTRPQLLAENVLLRQQLIVLRRQVKRPTITKLDRLVIVGASALTKTWRGALLLVQPETVLRWHRLAFQAVWRFKSRAPTRKHRVSPETVELIRRMAKENRLWGAERIRGELLKLGIRISKRTIQKYLDAARPPRPSGQRWATFLKNHSKDVWACDFLQTYDVWFRPIFAFFIVNVGTREVVHLGVTRAPTSEWAAQQLRNATPGGAGPRFIIRDRDSKFGAEFDRAAKAVGARVIRTAVRAPNMNATCERFLRSVRRECLDHVIIFSERQLRVVLTEYVKYFNRARPHQGLNQATPLAIATPACGNVIGLPVLGGLHRDYRRAA